METLQEQVNDVINRNIYEQETPQWVNLMRELLGLGIPRVTVQQVTSRLKQELEDKDEDDV